MKIPRGILFDVDKTLTRQDRTISSRTRAAIALAAAHNLKLGLCTGRQWSFLKPVIPLFPSTSLHVVAGGGQLINTQGKVIRSWPLKPTTVTKLWSLTKETGIGLVTGVGDTAYATSVQDQEIFVASHWVRGVAAWQQCQQCRRPPLVIVRPLSAIAEEKLSQWQAEGHLNYKVMISYAGERYADVTAPGVTKAAMAREWAKLLNLDLAQIAAVGDGLNDLEVIQAVGCGVAMGNSVPELKQVADYIIGQTDEDGLAIWLEQLVAAL
jgi:Cof subfamily protein (haloacid dehalogenase superfamily)